MDFADWLQQQMDIRGWTQADLARRSGITQAAVSRVMSGSRSPNVDTCRAIARAMGLPEETVLRAAGSLEPLPDQDETEENVIYAYRNLPLEGRQLLMDYIFFLNSKYGHKE